VQLSSRLELGEGVDDGLFSVDGERAVHNPSRAPGDRAKHERARIVGLVHGMPEAHDALAAGYMASRTQAAPL
jgi:hypothetical protein